MTASSIILRRRLRARRNGGRGHALRFLLVVTAALGTLASVGLAAGIGVVFAVYQSYIDDYVPIEQKLRQTNLGFTEIYDRGGPERGVLLGVLSNPDAQLLSPVPLSEISKWMIEATVSTEDNSFWTHPGVNFRGLLRAAWENYVVGEFGSGSGGSSITQQVVKNVYICPQVGDGEERCIAPERTLDRKLREIAYAIELERDYTKEQILQWYLNQISYGGQYIGVQAAAQGYFRKDAKDLTLAEAALLAGIPQAPTRYHPRLNCVIDAGGTCITDALGRTKVGGQAKARQEVVLDLMVAHGRLTRAEAEAAKAEELWVYPATSAMKAAAFIDNQVEPRLVRMCEKGLLPKRPGAANCTQSVHSAGYKVTTTLDWFATEHALRLIDEFVRRGLEQGCQCHNAAIVTIEPSTGQVIVYASNRNSADTSDPRIAGDIDQLVEINQPGSSFKPVVYLAWFEYAVKHPMSVLWDTSPLPADGATIVNPRPGGGSEGLISARAALGGSQNVPAFRAAQEAGVDNVIEMAKRTGITTLQQHFDPTFRAHPDVSYGASIATGGANIRAIDMAYMNAVIANMGVMVGVPHLADYVDLTELRSTALDTGAEYEKALQQRLAFQRGHIRLPGTRELDPVVVLEVRDAEGRVLFRQGEPERRQVVNPGSVWLLHTIMSDCTARFIIWGCGSSNNDLGLDFFMDDGTRVPGGVKTGTQQGPASASDTLETWMNGYTRYAATAVWVGNANNELVNDRSFAAANTTVRLFKNWMGWYHTYLRNLGVFARPAGFDDLQPANVRRMEVTTPATDRVLRREGGDLSGLCDQKVLAWVRTDVTYEPECEEVEIDTRNGLLASDQTPAPFREKRKFVRLPAYKPELARELAEKMGIPIAPTERSTGQAAVEIVNLVNGATIDRDTDVIGSVDTPSLERWRLQVGRGAAPSEWTTVGEGTTRVVNAVLGRIVVGSLQPGVYSVRLVAETKGRGSLEVRVVVNVELGRMTPTPTGTPPSRTPTPTGTPSPGPTPTPSP